MDINKNENYDIRITGINHEGQGVGRIGDFVVFVNNALPDELVNARIIKKTSSYAIGKVK